MSTERSQYEIISFKYVDEDTPRHKLKAVVTVQPESSPVKKRTITYQERVRFVGKGQRCKAILPNFGTVSNFLPSDNLNVCVENLLQKRSSNILAIVQPSVNFGRPKTLKKRD
jgi:hypothetical protein